MLISVVIPTRHRNELLAKCLDRLAPGRQTLDASNYEVIVTDDGVETTAERMIRERYPWARWFPARRLGPGANRNSGATHARGEWLAFTDDDCVPEPGWLAAFVAAAPDSDLLEGQTTCREGIHSPLLEAPLNLNGGNLWSCNMMVRRDAFERLAGFDEDFLLLGCEDLDFATRAKRAKLRIRFTPDAQVDHPPRMRPLGWQAGLRWQGRVMVWYKEGNLTPVWTWLPLHLLKLRISQILKYPLGMDSIRGLTSLAGEMFCVMAHLPSWERRYKNIRPGSPRRPLVSQSAEASFCEAGEAERSDRAGGLGAPRNELNTARSVRTDTPDDQ